MSRRSIFAVVLLACIVAIWSIALLLLRPAIDAGRARSLPVTTTGSTAFLATPSFPQNSASSNLDQLNAERVAKPADALTSPPEIQEGLYETATVEPVEPVEQEAELSAEATVLTENAEAPLGNVVLLPIAQSVSVSPAINSATNPTDDGLAASATPAATVAIASPTSTFEPTATPTAQPISQADQSQPSSEMQVATSTPTQATPPVVPEGVDIPPEPNDLASQPLTTPAQPAATPNATAEPDTANDTAVENSVSPVFLSLIYRQESPGGGDLPDDAIEDEVADGGSSAASAIPTSSATAAPTIPSATAAVPAPTPASTPVDALPIVIIRDDSTSDAAEGRNQSTSAYDAYSISVSDARPIDEANSSLDAQQIMLTGTLLNSAGAEITIRSDNLALLDSSGSPYAVHPASLDMSPSLADWTLATEESVYGFVVFEVPPDLDASAVQLAWCLSEPYPCETPLLAHVPSWK